MNGWALFLCVLGLLLALALLIYDHRRRQHEQLRIERLRLGALYREMLPLVKDMRRHDLDRVRVERDRVIFYGVCPPGKIGEFVLAEYSFPPMSRACTRTLTLLLAEDIPALREDTHYRLKRYRVERPNGMLDDAYLYVIRSYYKSSLMYKREHVELW